MIRDSIPFVLTEDLPQEGLQAGDGGWVVMVHDGGAAYEAEFVTLSGEIVAVVTVAARTVRAARKREIAHARLVA
jgi:hypothetical protein